jgi:selenoprotein W-related protein
MTRNRERFDAIEATVELNPDDLDFFTQLSEPLNVLVLAEDWCGDVIANLPVLGRLAEASGKLNLRIFPRDQHLDIMNLYLSKGQFQSIPVFVFFDASFRELGHWIERPARMVALQADFRANLFTSEPLLAAYAPGTPPGELSEEARERLMQAMGAFRTEHRAESDREVVREIRAIVAGGRQASEPEVEQSATEVVARPGTTHPGANQPVKVHITYCAACGYEPQTLALTSALMHEFVHDLAAIELIPWQDGAFDVAVGDQLVHSMYRDGGFPEHATIIRAVRERLAG